MWVYERDYGSTSTHNHIYLITVQLTYNLIKYYTVYIMLTQIHFSNLLAHLNCVLE